MDDQGNVMKEQEMIGMAAANTEHADEAGLPFMRGPRGKAGPKRTLRVKKKDEEYCTRYTTFPG